MPLLAGAHDRRARLVTAPTYGQRVSLDPRERREVTVVGGGLAGVTAALVLAERGARVALHEAGDALGGRVSSWGDRLGVAAGGDEFRMERGFHAFFRQYYNLRRMLRRIDPQLSFLRPCDDYPLFGPLGATESFARLPRRPPVNLVALMMRTPTIRCRDLVRIDGEAAAEMLAFDGDDTYARIDSMSAGEYLDSVGFPDSARVMLFEVFAHSFFNRQEDMSGAEMLMMFHVYFCGSAEGIRFDVLDRPFGDAVWTPMHELLERASVEVHLRSKISALPRPGPDGAVVLALDVAGLQAVVGANEWMGAEEPPWRDRIASLRSAPPFAVWRLWLDRDLRSDRQPFAGTAGIGIIDNISCVHRYQDEAGRWARARGGSVVELHAYALSADDAREEQKVRRELLSSLHAVYPESAAARILDERLLLRSDCPAFPPGSYAARPTTDTPTDRLLLAGDLIRLPVPTALMERAVTSGLYAANRLFADWNLRPEPVWSIPARGVLAPLQAWQRRRRSDAAPGQEQERPRQ